MNTTTVLDLIAARETAASAARDELLQQQAKLAAEAAAIDAELADLATNAGDDGSTVCGRCAAKSGRRLMIRSHRKAHLR